MAFIIKLDYVKQLKFSSSSAIVHPNSSCALNTDYHNSIFFECIKEYVYPIEPIFLQTHALIEASVFSIQTIQPYLDKFEMETKFISFKKTEIKTFFISYAQESKKQYSKF